MPAPERPLQLSRPDGETVRGYVVFERVGTAAPQPARARPTSSIEPGNLRLTTEIEEVAETRPWAVATRLQDAWLDARELWAQTTFFILDPNSWG
jgi:hypothetical protein